MGKKSFFGNFLVFSVLCVWCCIGILITVQDFCLITENSRTNHNNLLIFSLWVGFVFTLFLPFHLSGLHTGRGGADCYDEAQRSDGARWGHAGVSRGHHRFLSPQEAHPSPGSPHWAPQWAERRKGNSPSITLQKTMFVVSGNLIT